MKQIIAAIFALALAGGFGAPAVSRDTTPHERFDLMPRVMMTPAATLKVMNCGDVKDCIAPVAMYHNGIMYLRDDFDPRKEADRGALLHEFVHHLRFIGGESDKACGTEQEAYDTQIAWFKARGTDPDDEKHVGKLLAGPMLRFMIYQQRCGGLG